MSPTPAAPSSRISLTPDELSTASARAQETLASAKDLPISPPDGSVAMLGLSTTIIGAPRITSPEMNQVTVDFLRDRVDPAIDFCNSLFDPILATIDHLRSTTRQSRDQLVGPLNNLRVRLRTALQSWDDHLRAVQRQIDADRAIEVARLSREILEQDTLDKANELIESGKEEDATVLLDSFFGNGSTGGFTDDAPSSTFTLPPTKAGSRADGQSSSTLRRARVLDIDRLRPEFIDRSPNLRKIQAAVTKHGKQAERIVSIDGKGGAIEYYEKGSVTVRKRKSTEDSEPEFLDDEATDDLYLGYNGGRD